MHRKNNKFRINRLGVDVEKLDNTVDTKLDIVEKHTTDSFNKLRKKIENKNQNFMHLIDKTNYNGIYTNQINHFIVNNVQSLAHRLSTKLDKMEETDAIKSWFASQMDDQRLKMKDFVDNELKMSRTHLDKTIRLNFIIKGLVGSNEEFKTFSDCLKTMHKKLNSVEEMIYDIDDEVINYRKSKRFPFIDTKITETLIESR